MTEPHQNTPKVRRLRTLWVLARHPNKQVTAAIYEIAGVGRELRVHYGEDLENLIESLVSVIGERSLKARAKQIREMLETQGWERISVSEG